MKKLFYTSALVTFFIFSKIVCFGQNTAMQDSLAKGNMLYSEGKYNESIKTYENILSKGFESFEVYYNMGNALYKTNNITFAILNYERALKLSPKNEDALFNLEMAKRQVVDNIDILPEPGFMRWWHGVINTQTVDTWAIHSIVTFFIFLLLFGLFLFSRSLRNKRLSFWFALIFLSYSILTFSFGSGQKNHLTGHDSGVIVDRSVRMKGSPSETGTELFIIHEGISVQITDKLGDWIEIRLADGNKGWIKESALVRI